MTKRPCLLFTLGDVAGIGPEIIARSWPDLLTICRPVVVGDPIWVEKGAAAGGKLGKHANGRTAR